MATDTAISKNESTNDLVLFERVESVQFAAQLTIASAIRVFLRIANGLPETEQLFQLPKELIRLRLLEVLTRDFDHGYSSPWDVPVAIYMYVLNDHHNWKNCRYWHWASAMAFWLRSKEPPVEPKRKNRENSGKTHRPI